MLNKQIAVYKDTSGRLYCSLIYNLSHWHNFGENNM